MIITSNSDIRNLFSVLNADSILQTYSSVEEFTVAVAEKEEAPEEEAAVAVISLEVYEQRLLSSKDQHIDELTRPLTTMTRAVGSNCRLNWSP